MSRSATYSAVAVVALVVSAALNWHAEGGPSEDEVDLTLSEPRQAFTNGLGMKFVRVKAGKFSMGSPTSEGNRNAQEEQHEVEITRDFFVGVTEVTQRQYEAVMGTNPSAFCKGGQDADRVNGLDTGNFPVECVTWLQAQEFCKRLNAKEAGARFRVRYRLPTEAEWEYACRGGHKIKDFGKRAELPFHFARPSASLGFGQTNFNANWPYGDGEEGKESKRTCKVGSYEPNALGLYDMHGNVFEWCEDWWAEDVYKAKGKRKDPRGPKEGKYRVLRGGSWPLPGHNCRAAYRAAEAPGESDSTTGFRVVCDPRPK